MFRKQIVETTALRSEKERLLTKVAVLEKHVEKMKIDYNSQLAKVTEECEAQKAELTKQRDKIQSDAEVELELKQLIIAKKEFQMEDVKVQLKKLLKISRYPRLVTLLWEKYKESGFDQLDSPAGDTQSR